MSDFSQGMRVTVLGARGSMPTSDDDKRVFGGATSCYQVEAGGQTLFLDAGTGLANAAFDGAPVHILLTHTHLDHILGLPMCPALLKPGAEVHLYGFARAGLSVADQLARMISPPLWPLRLEAYPADVRCHDLTAPMKLGPFDIAFMESCHPGGATLYRLDACGKRLVYATDFEHTPQGLPALIEFARGADLLLYDGTYTDAEYPRYRGYGHSTAETGLRVQRECGAKRLALIHHDYHNTDAVLMERERRLGVRLARQGEVIAL